MNEEQYAVSYWWKPEEEEFWKYVEEVVSVPIGTSEKDNHEKAGQVILERHPKARLVSITYI